ncbi:MAG: ATP synthase F1 subunit delta [Cyclobacteriaceae bacterium]|nr:ATP synthase F1 subunit delta [Cyclobacteriaceae bacterium]
MSDFKVASRYARSVFDLAVELQKVGNIYRDMQLVQRVSAENRKLVTLLNNPIIRYDFKLRVLTRIFEKHVDPLTIKFFNLIARKNRASVLPEVSRVFLDLYDEHMGIVRASVTSAVALTDQIKKEFEELVAKETGKKVEMETTIDESMLGGYVLRVGDKQIDDSLKTKLNNLRRELKHRH